MAFINREGARGAPFVSFGSPVPVVNQPEEGWDFKLERINLGEILKKLEGYSLLGDRVLVRQLSVEQIGNIELPEVTQHTTAKIYKGVVVMVGEEEKVRPLEVGMVVFYPIYATQDMPFMGVKNLVSINRPNVVGIWEGDDREWRID